MWLKLLTILRRGGWPAALLLLAAHASAATISFSGGTVAGCTRSGNTYSCAAIPLVNYDDQAVIASGYTVVLSGGFAPGYNQGLSMSGSAALQTTSGASIDLSGSNNINISGGNFNVSGNFKLGASTQSITANVSAATITTAGSATTITGNVSASSAINFGSNTTINGTVSAASISTGSATTISGALTVSGLADLGSNIKVGGNLTANAVKTGSPAQISGAIDAKTTVDLGSGTTVGGSIKGTTVTTTSPVTLKGDVNASTSFQLASGSTVTGNLTSPSIKLDASGSTVKGDISTTGTLDVGSQVSVTGTVNAAGLVLRASGSVINGTTKITGNVSMESGTTINGDLNARDVTTASGSAVINGNIAVNSIYIDWNNSVNGVITCTGALNGTEPCSCVSKPQYYNYTPRCAAAPTAGVHHFQIEHSGVALTCQPQSVKLTACTDANCTGTYGSPVTAALLPGGGNVSFTGSTNATVSQSSAGTATLSAAMSGVTNATVCPNASTGTNDCRMVFKDEGLVLGAPDHLAWAGGVKLNVQALKNAQGSCVPLLQGTVPVQFSCSYINPAASAANPVPVYIGGNPVACGSNTKVSLNFDSNGLATPSLQYAEVGQTRISAAYTSGNLGASGVVQFTTAPAELQIKPIRRSMPDGTQLSSTAFAKASEPFYIKLVAVNARGDATKNFGRESPAQQFYMDTPMLTNPINGQKPLTIGQYKSIVDGATVAEDGQKGLWQFDETGTLRISVRQADATTYYLGNKTTGFNTQASKEITFVPDHFDLTLLAPQPMACNQVGGLNNPCAPLNQNGKFLYSGQPFAVQVNAYVGAKDIYGNYLSPQNYVGAAARAVALSVWSATDSSVPIPSDSSNGTGQLVWSGTLPAAGPFTFAYDTTGKKTIGKLDTSASGPLPSFDFRLKPTAPTTMVLRAIDADGASSAGFGEPLLTIVSGRLEVSNVSGPLSGSIPVVAKAQYWNGKAYLFNSQFAAGDTPTTVPLFRAIAGVNTYYLKYSNCKNGLYSGNASAPCSASAMPKAAKDSISFKNGVGTFYLAQPVPGLSRNGSVDVALQNGSEDLIKYLPSGSGTVVFGVYRSGPLIYTREVYN